MDIGKTYIFVILPLRLSWEPCYIAPQGTATGDRVKVVFAGKEYIGVVSGTGVEPPAQAKKISEILSVEKDMDRIGENEIAFWRQMASYYLCSVGEVYKAAYPSVKMEASAQESARRKIERLKAGLAKLEGLIPRARSAKGRYEQEAAALRKEILSLEDGPTQSPGPIGNPVRLSPAQQKARNLIQEAFGKGSPVLLCECG